MGGISNAQWVIIGGLVVLLAIEAIVNPQFNLLITRFVQAFKNTGASIAQNKTVSATNTTKGGTANV